MTAPTSLADPDLDCENCDTEPTPGTYLPPHPARHTLITAQGPVRYCTWCAFQLVLSTETYGSRVTLSIAPASALKTPGGPTLVEAVS